LVDLSLLDADISSRFGVSVVALQRGSNVIPTPKKSTILRADDYLVVIGADESVQKLSNHS
jgi:trk system potassium uptake protein